jgi:hypothetical protein
MNQEKNQQKSRPRSAENVNGSKASSSRVEKLNEYVTYPVNKAKPEGINSLSRNEIGTFNKE